MRDTISAAGAELWLFLWLSADLLVGKPGGLTTSEALAKGLPLVIVNPIPGQEERNADHLLEEGAAIRCNNLPALAWKLDRLLDDPARLAAIRANTGRLGRPHAAADIVSIAVGGRAVTETSPGRLLAVSRHTEGRGLGARPYSFRERVRARDICP